MSEPPDATTIQTKIDALRKLHKEWDPSAESLIDDFERKIAKLTLEQSYADLDIIV